MARASDDDLTGQGSVPVPDPTKLTTDAVNAATAQWRRDLETVRELFAHEIEALNGRLTARLDAAEESGELRRAALAEIRPQTERQIKHLQELHNERFAAVASRFDDRNVWLEGKFEAIDQRFAERDVRTEQAAAAATSALDAALRSARELGAQQNDANAAAAAKTETSVTKQIDQISVIIANLDKSFTQQITELKERLDRDQGVGTGSRETTAELRAVDAKQSAERAAVAATQRANISIGLAVLTVIVAVLVAVFTHL